MVLRAFAHLGPPLWTNTGKKRATLVRRFKRTLESIRRAEKLSHIIFRKLLYFGCPTNSVWARSYDHLKVNGMSEPDPFINQWREIPWIVWKFLDFSAISWRKTPFKMIVRPSYFVSRLYSSPPPILKVWTSYDNSKSVKSQIFIQNVGHDRPQMTVLAWTLSYRVNTGSKNTTLDQF